MQLFNEWVATGRKLGEIERERARQTERNAGIQVTGRDVQKARHQWIRTVNALIKRNGLRQSATAFPK